MFNWLFGRDKDKYQEWSDQFNVEMNARGDRLKQLLLQLYGNKRNYTFPDGKTITWELGFGSKRGFDGIDEPVLQEYINGELWQSSKSLKELPTLSPPASQLFLILLNDQRNIKVTTKVVEHYFPVYTYTHEKLRIAVTVDPIRNTFSIEAGLKSLNWQDIENIKTLYGVYNTAFNLTTRQERYKAAMQKRAKSLETRKLDAYLKTITK
jgi:hypothetical protein